MTCRQSCRPVKTSAVTLEAPVEQMLDSFLFPAARNVSLNNGLTLIGGANAVRSFVLKDRFINEEHRHARVFLLGKCFASVVAPLAL